jgi:hypothetical protein
VDPITTVTTALTVGSNAVSLLKGVAEQAKALGKSEIISNLIDVQVAMMELLSEQQKLIDENRALREKVCELGKIIEARRSQEGLWSFITMHTGHAMRMVHSMAHSVPKTGIRRNILFD